jgi:hypothetical protein
MNKAKFEQQVIQIEFHSKVEKKKEKRKVFLNENKSKK